MLQNLARLQPEMWFSQDDVVTAIKQVEPDFQRPTGNYDTWYIRDTTTQEFLKGFEQWNLVEGRLLRFLLQGPLHWLGIVDLAEPSAGDDMQVSLSALGARWLGHDLAEPADDPRRPLEIDGDFTLALSLNESLSERFRVERFAQWQKSYPRYEYQINQRSLKRAADEGISPDRILTFLRRRSHRVPENVVSALTRATKLETAADSNS